MERPACVPSWSSIVTLVYGRTAPSLPALPPVDVLAPGHAASFSDQRSSAEFTCSRKPRSPGTLVWQRRVPSPLSASSLPLFPDALPRFLALARPRFSSFRLRCWFRISNHSPATLSPFLPLPASPSPSPFVPLPSPPPHVQHHRRSGRHQDSFEGSPVPLRPNASPTPTCPHTSLHPTPSPPPPPLPRPRRFRRVDPFSCPQFATGGEGRLRNRQAPTTTPPDSTETSLAFGRQPATAFRKTDNAIPEAMWG